MTSFNPNYPFKALSPNSMIRHGSGVQSIEYVDIFHTFLLDTVQKPSRLKRLGGNQEWNLKTTLSIIKKAKENHSCLHFCLKS